MIAIKMRLGMKTNISYDRCSHGLGTPVARGLRRVWVEPWTVTWTLSDGLRTRLRIPVSFVHISLPKSTMSALAVSDYLNKVGSCDASGNLARKWNEHPSSLQPAVFSYRASVQGFILSPTSVWVYLGHWHTDVRSRHVHISYQRQNCQSISNDSFAFEDVQQCKVHSQLASITMHPCIPLDPRQTRACTTKRTACSITFFAGNSSL